MPYGGFPATYQPYPNYQPYNAYQQQMQQAQVQQQTMSPPTIHAEIIQFGTEEEIDRFPMQAGASQMFMSKDEQHIVIKTMYANGQYNKEHYDKRPPTPPEPRFATEDYERIAAIVAAMMQKKEENHEPV